MSDLSGRLTTPERLPGNGVDVHGDLYPYVARAASDAYVRDQLDLSTRSMSDNDASLSSVDISQVRSQLEELRFRRSAWNNFERLYAQDGHPVVGTPRGCPPGCACCSPAALVLPCVEAASREAASAGPVPRPSQREQPPRPPRAAATGAGSLFSPLPMQGGGAGASSQVQCAAVLSALAMCVCVCVPILTSVSVCICPGCCQCGQASCTTR